MKAALCLCLLVTAYACQTDSDCGRMEECHSGHCEHKALWPLTEWEVAGSVLFLVCLSCGIAAGIGGGLLVFPILLMLFNFGPHEGIPIINTTGMVGALVAYLQRCTHRLEGNAQPLVDYAIAMQSLPAFYLGSVYGVRLNRAFPRWLLVLLIILSLAYILYQTLKM